MCVKKHCRRRTVGGPRGWGGGGGQTQERQHLCVLQEELKGMGMVGGLAGLPVTTQTRGQRNQFNASTVGHPLRVAAAVRQDERRSLHFPSTSPVVPL